ASCRETKMNLSFVLSGCSRVSRGMAVAVLTVAGMPLVNRVLADDRVEHGRKLFEHRWTAGDPLSTRGDGLGPMHNADSCIDCHLRAGTGGAGFNEHNVALLTLQFPPDQSADSKSAARMQAAKIHPGFDGPGGTSTVLLHHLSTEAEYETWRLSVLGF